MELLHFLLELLTHTKDVLLMLFQQYGIFIYAILFLIIFVETGLVVMPFLPGDSLLFTAGMLCAMPSGLNIWLLIPLLIFAAILGDNVNYFVGRFFNQKVLGWEIGGKRLVKQAWLDKTEEFFKSYGTKAIILARFVPIVRTVTPFVAGVGKMQYRTFLPYDIFGGILWVSSVTIIGYFLGQIPFVEHNLEKFIIGIVILSVLPMVWAFVKTKMKK
jgi:membrane-associated protein